MSKISDLLAQIEQGPDDPDAMTNDELGDWWASAALALAAAVKTDTIKVRYSHQDPQDTDGMLTWSAGELELPHWCSGDPAAAVALYLFGYAGAVKDLDIDVEVID